MYVASGIKDSHSYAIYVMRRGINLLIAPIRINVGGVGSPGISPVPAPILGALRRGWSPPLWRISPPLVLLGLPFWPLDQLLLSLVIRGYNLLPVPPGWTAWWMRLVTLS